MSSAFGVIATKVEKVNFLNTVRVLVGAEETEFLLHKDMLSSRSPFSKAAAADRWTSTSNRSIKLPEDEVEVFNNYINCVYRNTLSCSTTQQLSLPDLVELYILADKLGDLMTTNICIDQIICTSDESQKHPDTNVIRIAYQRTACGSPLRTLMLHYYIHEASSNVIKENVDELPLGFLQDYMREIACLQSGSGERKLKNVFGTFASEREACYYHQHTDEVPRCVMSSE